MQSVLGEGSHAYNSEIHGECETSGQQNVYDDGAAFFTDVMSGGEQNLSTKLKDSRGLSVDTRFFARGYRAFSSEVRQTPLF